MGQLNTYFFDTYAFHEIIVQNNPNYLQFSKGIIIITTKLNLMELHYGLMRLYGKETADMYYDQLAQWCVEITDEVIKKANVFRYANKLKKLSYVDCIGYTAAKLRGIKFLTGDMQFKDFENVEYVK